MVSQFTSMFWKMKKVICVYGKRIVKGVVIVMGEFRLTEEQQHMISVLSQALPYLRKEMGVSQTELANKVGVSRQMISLIERQQQPMTWTMFLAIVFFFKCNNEFDKGKKQIVQKYPNVVEQILLLEHQMNTRED